MTIILQRTHQQAKTTKQTDLLEAKKNRYNNMYIFHLWQQEAAFHPSHRIP